MKKIKKALSATLATGLVLSSLATGVSANDQSGKEAHKAHISSIVQNSPLLQHSQNQQSQNPAMSADTLVVKYKTPLTSSQNQQAQATVVQNIQELQYAIVKVKNKDQLDKVINQYMSYDNVLSVKPSVYFTPFAGTDEKASEQYHLDMLQIAKAHGLAGKHVVKVAVIDQGVDDNHPELKDKLIPGYNTVNPLRQPLADYHGTHVAGIIGAEKGNEVGGFGVNPNVEIMSIDVFNRQWGATDYAIAEGILYAVKNGAKVINMSLGSFMPSPVIEDAVKEAVKQNVVVVAAAGNTGDDTKSYPASYEGVISVGAVNDKKELAEFSTFGPSVDIVAPGDSIYAPLYDYEKGSTYAELSGTSMASPIIAGVASLLLSKNPNLTPLQVEYILEKTADDLGSNGFDATYGNGLVNPVAALQFDMNQLPALEKKDLTKEEILSTASVIDPATSQSYDGAIVKPYEEKWYQFEAKEGEYVQLQLNGAEHYDFGLKVNLYGEGYRYTKEINNVAENLAEGTLVKIPFSGPMAVSVVELNGNYDDSEAERVSYSLDVNVASDLPEEELTSFSNPTKVTLPFSGKGTLVSEDFKLAAEDFYKVEVNEQQVVRVELSAVPGINSALSVYFEDEMLLKELEQIPADKRAEIDFPLYPIMVANNNGYGEGEVLTFEAMPGESYIIKVTNDAPNYFGMYDYIINPNMETENIEPEHSLVPYYLDIEGKVLPPDEDGYPFGMMPMDMMEEKSLEAQKASIAAIAEDEAYDPYEDYLSQIESAALPYEVGEEASGYLQMMGDEDWYSFEAPETGVYKFDLVNSPQSYPMVEIYEIGTEETPDGEEYRYLRWLGTNISWTTMAPETKKELYTSLRKGNRYFVKLNENYFNNSGISFNPYAFTSEVVLKNHEDAYESNDETTDVKNLPSSSFTGNFATAGDRDVFYLNADKDALYGVTMKRGQLDDALKQLPKGLVDPFHSFVAVIEDSNNNRTIDEEEWRKIQYIDPLSANGMTTGAFKTTEGKNYFILLESYTETGSPFTLWPYEFTLQEQNQKDEDAGSVVNGNIPSKPLFTKKVTSRLFSATGYLNTGVDFGDEDWYQVNVIQDSLVRFRMVTSDEIDSVVEVYHNGKLIHSADEYAWGDDEVFNLQLKAGSYHVRLRDANNNAAVTPYEFKVYFME
ncbi:hypothetical protein GCM10008967_02720 [Bacillus carboniphilus]|uniref:Peptidase S8/S53 domain-containing protein n=1 Tax=Bacillus carboniphilus TaxID=86663 RepID=A0ABN0VRM4_9BACI